MRLALGVNPMSRCGPDAEGRKFPGGLPGSFVLWISDASSLLRSQLHTRLFAGSIDCRD